MPAGSKLLEIDLAQAVKEVTTFVRKVVDEAGAKGVVLGLSGGVDSALTAVLCVKALGKTQVLGVIMPAEFTPKQDIQDAEELARNMGINTKLVRIEPVVQSLCKELDTSDSPNMRIPVANIRARVRMIILYYYANLHGYLVAGTGDRSEVLIGYFTKYGDGGADFMPISHLYKTQVRALAEYLGVPRSVAYKPSSPQLFPGQRTVDEIPLDYEELDPVLVCLFDKKLPPTSVSELTGVSEEKIREILLRHEASSHKRVFPVT
jgi:NAD+ synthase